MKKLLILFAIIFILPLGVSADRVTLNSTEVLSTPNATHMDWYIDLIDAKTKTLRVRYRWLDSTGAPIFLGNRTTWQTWSCRNVVDNPITINADCVGVGDPWSCCTGVGTGDCDETVTDFSDIFTFKIRTQDVGTSIGVGLRTLIWNKMRADILTGGNNGTFED